ncbi:MAG TPA: replicative DNA helicase [Edaphobacter sp.]|nr:replicative DNA helicase [Edaphobacter sp.]
MPEPVNTDFSLPGNLHAEMTVLGACLVDEVAVVESTTLLTAADFYTDSHRRIFSAIVALKAGAVDIVTVGDYLRTHKELDAVGGLPFLASLSEGLPRKLSIESYAKIVHDSARNRDIYRMTESIGQSVLANEDSPETILQLVKRWTEAIEDETGTDAPMESVGEYLDAHYADEERIFDLDPKQLGVPSGFPWQDDKTGGYLPGKLYIIAGRPSMGKTAKAINDVSNMCLKAKVPVALFTFEQDKSELLQRLLCCRATANLTDFIKGKSDDGDRRAIKKAYHDYREAPLYWDDSPGLTASQIRAKCLRLAKKLKQEGKELGAVVIDQLSFMSWTDVYQKGLQAPMLIGFVTRALKRVAKELHVPVILLCQIKRTDKGSKNNRPSLADLKESGSIEENADVVLFVHREEYYDRNDPALKGKGECIIAKQRQGPVGSHVLRYMAHATKWIDDWTPKDGDDDGAQIPW